VIFRFLALGRLFTGYIFSATQIPTIQGAEFMDYYLLVMA
jgi:hypothetical protein